MLVVYLLVSLLYHSGNCSEISEQTKFLYDDNVIKCLLGIIKEYMSEKKVMTHVGNKADDEELYQAIHTANIVSILARKSSKTLSVPHEGYLISGRNSSHVIRRIPNIIKDSTWNPTARFIILVRTIYDVSDLYMLFDECLRLHMYNVVVINATEDAHLYTYNPFDNYGCGKLYDTIISYGECLDASSINLYPDKAVTGLRNCTFNVLLANWPPYTILSNNSDESSPLRDGAEPYLVRLLGLMEDFEINIMNNYNEDEEFPTVSINMEAKGSLKKLQDNEADIVLGGMLLTPSRAVAFHYIYGHLAYTDEIRFIVKRASFVPPWKNVYLEFDSTVWVLLILVLMLYSMLVIILLHKEDKSYVVMRLLDNLVLHGRNIQCRLAVKCVLILWVWFAYLVNTFYQSSLVSLTTNPAQEYQISTEEDIIKYQLKPCFSTTMGKYYVESIQSDDVYQKTDGCYGSLESVSTVIKSKDVYTILLNGQYEYNRRDFYDEYGKPQVVALPKPYSKVIYSIYMYKGFPLIERLRQRSIKLRENGLVDKVVNDMIYLKQIKQRFREEKFHGRFAIPWRIYIFGCVVSVITFVVEVLSKHNDK